MTEIVRVLRVLEYVGPREAVERTLARGGVPMNGVHEVGALSIRSAIVQPFPEYVCFGPSSIDEADQIETQGGPMADYNT